jgi:hypothetical protein
MIRCTPALEAGIHAGRARQIAPDERERRDDVARRIPASSNVSNVKVMSSSMNRRFSA